MGVPTIEIYGVGRNAKEASNHGTAYGGHLLHIHLSIEIEEVLTTKNAKSAEI